MTITSPPKLGQIHWTAYSPVEGDSAPVDPLRFETYAERLGNALFPGITNRVERVRYFGMVCAGIEAAGASASGLSGREHTRLVRLGFTRFEAAWAFAQVAQNGRGIKERPAGASQPRLKYEFRGLRGANRALAFWAKTSDTATVDGRGGYRLLQAQEAQGGLGAYLVALREHGWVHPDRLETTASGAALARAFYDGTQRRTRSALTEDGRKPRADWQRAGERYGLNVPSADERRSVHAALFDTGRTLGRFVDALPQRLREPGTTRQAFQFTANGNGRDAGDARFTLAFDELRRSALRLFARVGNELRQRQSPAAPADLLPADELLTLSTEVQVAAAHLATFTPPAGLDPIVSLAVELGSVTSDRVVPCLVAFHRREGRRWIEPVGVDRLQLGAAGTFQDPGDGFHGYTLGAALSVYQDSKV